MEKYKEKIVKTRIEVKFKVGYLVMAYLRGEIMSIGQPTKLVMIKIGPLKILHKYGVNAYELELPPDMGIISNI